VKLINSIYFRITFGYIVLIFPFSIIFSYFYFSTYKSISPLKELTEIRNYPHQIIFEKYINYLDDFNLILYAKMTNNFSLLKGFLSSKETFAPMSDLNEKSCFCHYKEKANSANSQNNDIQNIDSIKNVEHMLSDEKNCIALNNVNKCMELIKKRLFISNKTEYLINTLLSMNVFSNIKDKLLKESFAAVPILYSINDLIIGENVVNSLTLIQLKLSSIVNTSFILALNYDAEIKNDLSKQIDSLLAYIHSRQYEEFQIYYFPNPEIAEGYSLFDNINSQLLQLKNKLILYNPDNKQDYINTCLNFYNFYKNASNNFKSFIFNKSKDFSFQFNEIYSQLSFYEHMYNSFLILTLIAMIAGIFLSYIILKPILKSITNLRYSIEKIKMGDFDVSFDELGEDEISELKKAFVRMSHALKERENEILQRNKELAEMQASLIQSSKLSAIGMLATGIAHELNQPLMVINSYIDMLKDEFKENEKLIEDIDVLKKQIAKMKNIILQLSDFSKTENNFVYTDINRLIENVLSFTETYIRKHNIIIEKEYASDLPLVFINQSQIEQVMLNLLTNAVDAIKPKNSGKISIKTYCVNSKEVHISITDDGIGIKEEELSKIFEPFYTTKKVGEGIGLGLYVSYNIIKAHKGSIKVSSEENKGSCFTVMLPIKPNMETND